MRNLMTFNEFVKILKISPNTVKTWKRRGDLPPEIFFKIGGTLYILEDKFDEWVSKRQSGIGVPNASI